MTFDQGQAFVKVLSVCRCQILAGVKLVVGCPVVSSAGNMRFWLHLCQAAGLQGAEAAVQGFSAAAQAGKEASTEYCHRYNTELMRKVRLHWIAMDVLEPDV